MTTLIPPQQAPSWDFTPTKILDLTNKTIDDSNALFAKLAKIETPTIENFVRPLIERENETDPLLNQLTFLLNVSADKDVRDASTKSSAMLQDWSIETQLRHDLFIQLDKLWSIYKDNGKFKKENLEFYRYMEKAHKNYVRAGLNLPEDKRELVKTLKQKIAANCLQYLSNLGEQQEYVAFTEEELEGVSDTLKEQFEKTVEDGVEKLKVTFKYPDIFPVLETAKNPETRKRAFVGDQNKVPQNEALLLETLKLRDQLASVLNYDTYAAYNLEKKMAKRVDAVMDFLEDLKVRLAEGGMKDMELLKQLKKAEYEEMGRSYDGHFYNWDNRYYTNKYMKDHYGIDDEKVSEYFPIQSAIDGMLKIYETLMSLKFVEENDPNRRSVWHQDVKQFAVWNVDVKDKPTFVGWIYFDLHPRPGKYGHAANFGLSSSYLRPDGSRSYTVTALVCNFSKPTPTKPSLLKHNELITFFHELGHGIHDLVGNCSVGSLNGPGATEFDFVEAPSQMLEHWPWNKDMLQQLSRHYKTDEKIPDELVKSLVATRNVFRPMRYLRQLHFGFFDMTVHTTKDIDHLDLRTLWNKLREEITHVDNGGVLTTGYNSFSHIMSDEYSAGYYGYFWASVFADDMYYTRFADDPLDPETGREYRDIILARGALYEISDNLHEFLGRESNNTAFLQDCGLA
ncbi:HCL678Wp [Eremothecium sinecaudum]|uniref:HCL678Wp n=1 Tax=Eremothecium sinecaudum TaxID=45286 RepID=A0A109UXQ9_9SACH|nr:HCL678Wp [Eremothecium sinecaudum]AMD19473.1 HCL678Wp [Eremothecium sinecaudum]